MATQRNDDSSYRAEKFGNAWLCIKGDDYMSAADYDTQEDAQDAADEMNGKFFADGTPANGAARALLRGVW